MESVPDRVRGRVFGVFVMVGGLIGSIGPWAMGRVSMGLGAQVADPAAYRPVYILLGVLILSSLVGLALLKWAKQFALRHPQP
jgi:MFS family permease